MTTLDYLSTTFQNAANGTDIPIGSGVFSVTPPAPTTDPAPVLWQWKGKSGIRVRGAGIGQTVIKTTCAGGLFELRNCEDITFQDMTFAGSGMNMDAPSTAYYSALTHEGVNRRIHYRRCRFVDWGDQAIGHLHQGWDEDCLVEDCIFENIGNLAHPGLGGDGAGVAWSGQNNRIVRSRFTRCLRGVELETKWDDHEVCGNVIDQCTFEDTIWQGIIICPTHHKGELFHDNRITNCSFFHPGGFYRNYNCDRGIYVQGGHRLLIAGNQIEAHGGCTIVSEQCADIDGLTIQGNELRSHLSNGVDLNAQLLWPLRNVVLQGNVIGPCGGRGAFLKVDGLTVAGNVFGERGKQVNGQPWEAYVIDRASRRATDQGNVDTAKPQSV